TLYYSEERGILKRDGFDGILKEQNLWSPGNSASEITYDNTYDGIKLTANGSAASTYSNPLAKPIEIKSEGMYFRCRFFVHDVSKLSNITITMLNSDKTKSLLRTITPSVGLKNGNQMLDVHLTHLSNYGDVDAPNIKTEGITRVRFTVNPVDGEKAEVT